MKLTSGGKLSAVETRQYREQRREMTTTIGSIKTIVSIFNVSTAIIANCSAIHPIPIFVGILHLTIRLISTPDIFYKLWKLKHVISNYFYI